MTDLARRGPLGLKQPKAPKKPRKPMRQRSKKRQAYLDSPEGKVASEHMDCVACLPCAICSAPPPSIVHHCIHDRFSAKRASDFETIPLCEIHHDHGHPEAIHTDKKAWRKKHGPDHGFIKRTLRLVKEMQLNVDF